VRILYGEIGWGSKREFQMVFLKGDFKCGIKRCILNGDYNRGFKMGL